MLWFCFVHEDHISLLHLLLWCLGLWYQSTGTSPQLQSSKGCTHVMWRAQHTTWAAWRYKSWSCRDAQCTIDTVTEFLHSCGIVHFLEWYLFGYVYSLYGHITICVQKLTQKTDVSCSDKTDVSCSVYCLDMDKATYLHRHGAYKCLFEPRL